MNKELTCQQVSALINFYIEDKLNPRLKEYVNLHISKCPHCKKKIEDLKKILLRYGTNKTNNLNNLDKNELAEEAKHRLSAYIDNELSTTENMKIKKMAISNPTARKELENMYRFRQILHSAYEKTRNDVHLDYSKKVLSQIQENNDYTTTYFYKLATIFVLLLTGIIAGFIYLYF